MQLLVQFLPYLPDGQTVKYTNLTDKRLEEKNSLLILSVHVIAASVLVRKARISKEAIDIGYKE